MMIRSSLIGLVLLAILLPNVGNATVLGFYADAGGTSCHLDDPGPGGLVTVYVLMKYSQGATNVFFTAPVPPQSGLAFLGDEPNYQTVGSSQTGIQIALNPCQGGNIVILKMHFYRTFAGAPCTAYEIQPGAGFMDCSFAEQSFTTLGVILNAQGGCSDEVPFQDELPVDGATNVPLVTTLSWSGGYVVCNPPVVRSASSPPSYPATLYFGTSPAAPAVGIVSSPYSVGPLNPGTKYYWRLENGGEYVYSPLWSFTTTTSVAIRPSTWGAIKALYR